MSLKTQIVPCLGVASPHRPQRSADAQNRECRR